MDDRHRGYPSPPLRGAHTHIHHCHQHLLLLATMKTGTKGRGTRRLLHRLQVRLAEQGKDRDWHYQQPPGSGTYRHDSRDRERDWDWPPPPAPAPSLTPISCHLYQKSQRTGSHHLVHHILWTLETGTDIGIVTGRDVVPRLYHCSKNGTTEGATNTPETCAMFEI